MRTCLILGLVAALAAGDAAPAAPATAPTLGLADCQHAAVVASRGLRRARRQVAIADWQVQEAWAPSLPQISADWRWQQRSNDPGARMNGAPMVTGERDTTSGGISANLTLWDFGRAGATRDVLRALREEAGRGSERARQGLELEVARAFYQHLAAVRLVGLAQLQVELLDRQWRVADDLFRHGQVAAQDRQAVDVQRRDRVQSRLKAEEVRDTSRAALNRLMDRPLDAPLALADELERPTWTGAVEEATHLALVRRPDLDAAGIHVRAGREAVSAARTAFLPRIYAFGQYQGMNDQYLLNKTWWAGGVGVSWSIFDGGATVAQAGRALLELEQAQDAATDAEAQVRLEVRSAWLTLTSVRERAAVAAAALALAEENLRSLQERYAQGLATSTDVLAEEARLAQARDNHATALYDHQVAYAVLVHAMGCDPLAHEEKKP